MATAQQNAPAERQNPGRFRIWCLVLCFATVLQGARAQITQDQHHSGSPKLTSKYKSKYDVSRIGSRGIGGGLNLYSIERERQLGKELSADAEWGMILISDPTLTEYVNRISQNLIRHSDARTPLVVKVIDSDEVSAFTFPGGFLYVSVGLIVTCDSEAELAGVIAHEVAHVAARHATRMLTRRELVRVSTIPLLFVGGGVATAITQAATVVTPITFMKFTRNDEREADLLALEYVYDAGYDPTEFVRLFERMRTQNDAKVKKTSAVWRLFATHPLTSDRIRRAQAAIDTLLPPKTQYVLTTSEFDEIRLRLRGRKVGDSDYPTLRRRERNASEGSNVPGGSVDH